MKKRLIILFICLFVIMIGLGLSLPVLPFYIERIALNKGVSASLATTHVGILTGIFALMQFFFAPLWGKWSDRIGRRPLLLTGLGGYAISMIFFGIGTNLEMLYGARVLGGIFSAAIFPAATAYVADVTSLKDRGRGMAWLGSAVSLGVVVGPVVGVFLSRINVQLTYRFAQISFDSFSIPFFATALLAFLTLATVLWFLPESLKPPCVQLLENQTPIDDQVEPQSGGKILTKLPRQFLMLAFLSQFALALFEGTFALHAQKILGYSPEQMGIIFVMCGLVMAIAQGAVVSWLIEKAGEKKLLPAGFAFMAMGLAMLMTTKTLLSNLVYVGLFAFGIALITPVLAVLVSKYSRDKPGMALGLLNSANSLGQAGGPAIAGYLLVRYIHLPYLLTALLLGACAIFLTVKLLKTPEKLSQFFVE